MCLDKQAERIGDGRGFRADILDFRAGGHGAYIESSSCNNVTQTDDDFLCFVSVLAIRRYLRRKVRATNRPWTLANDEEGGVQKSELFGWLDQFLRLEGESLDVLDNNS